MPITITLKEAEINALCSMAVDSSNITHTDPEARKALADLVERLKIAVAAQALLSNSF